MRIALGIEYDGAGYHGWQRQLDVQSIQSCLEMALSRVANHPVNVKCAGRTDAGVHAIGQVVHFDTYAERSLRAWKMGTNSYLPATIRVAWAVFVNDEFHARFSALNRQYHYYIYNRAVHSAIFHRGLTACYQPLNENLMIEAARYLVGEHDFSSFRSMECQAKTTVRIIHHCLIQRIGDFVILDIKANAFLHHMVRNIAGVLMEIGKGQKPPLWAKQLLEARNRLSGGVTAPAAGLYLVTVEYPATYQLPHSDMRFLPELLNATNLSIGDL